MSSRDTVGSLQKAAPARGFAVGRSFVFDKVRGIAMPSVCKTYSAPPTSKRRQVADPYKASLSVISL